MTSTDITENCNLEIKRMFTCMFVLCICISKILLIYREISNSLTYKFVVQDKVEIVTFLKKCKFDPN